MEVKGDSLILTAFNLNTAIRVSVAAIQDSATESVHQLGKMCVPAKLLELLVTQLPSEPITLEYDANSIKLFFHSSVGTHQIQGIGDDEYPALPTFSGEPTALPVALLLEALNCTEFATSKDESKQTLCRVYFEFNPHGQIDAGATDGHRMTHWQGYLNTEQSVQRANFPSKMLPDLRRLMTGSETLTLQFDSGITMSDELLPTSGYAQFRMSNGNLLMCRLLDGQYPNYRQLIPNAFARSVTIDRKQLLASIQRVAIFSEGTRIVTVTFDPVKKTAHVHAHSSENNVGDEDLAIEMTGGEIAIAFSADYFIELLRVMEADRVVLYMNGNTSPIMLKEESFRHIIMPVQIRG